MKSESKFRLKFYIPLTVIIVAILTGIYFWYSDYSRYITTDDAHVDADNVGISSKMLGRIASIYVSEGDTVRQGQLLADLDSSDLIAQRNQIMAQKMQTQANLNQSEVRFTSDQKGIRVLEINRDRSAEDFERIKSQMKGGVATQEQFDHARKAFEASEAQLDAARSQLLVSKSMIASARAAVEASDAQIKVIETQLKNAKFYAPSDGTIARQWLFPGDVVQPGQSVLTLIRSKDVWVVAFLEETKISDIRVGQDVKFTIDAFPDVRFKGKVFLMGSSTASVFSLIPASNASGNFTKVTQRIPVRISIDGTEDDNDISSRKILSGMSAVVKIIRR